MNKKAELTTQQLVTIIILVISFAIILFLIFRLDLGGTTNEQVCHNSIILASKGKGLVSSADCKTTTLCISGGGECEGTYDEKLKVNKDKKEEIYKILADKMANCWWMFGEGKIDYSSFLSGTSCSICYKIKFDTEIAKGKLKDSIGSNTDFYNFLANTEKSKAISYFNYLYEVNNINLFIEHLESANKGFSRLYLNEIIKPSLTYVIFTSSGKEIYTPFEKVAPVFIFSEDTEKFKPFECDKFITKI